jgi:hypothetical protein
MRSVDDYKILEDLLKKQAWLEANKVTRSFLLSEISLCESGHFANDVADPIFYKQLSTIDELWSKYTNGRFGFTAQFNLFKKFGKDKNDFYGEVGWLVNGQWAFYEQLSFHSKAPFAHLPILNWHGKSNGFWIWDIDICDLMEWVTLCKQNHHPVSRIDAGNSTASENGLSI